MSRSSASRGLNIIKFPTFSCTALVRALPLRAGRRLLEHKSCVLSLEAPRWVLGPRTAHTQTTAPAHTPRA
eukprot:388268-Prymnesium_polylepis.3